jgi:hypothetical protein
MERLRFQIGLQLWKILMQRWKLIVLRKLLERIQKFQPERERERERERVLFSIEEA